HQRLLCRLRTQQLGDGREVLEALCTVVVGQLSDRLAPRPVRGSVAAVPAAAPAHGGAASLRTARHLIGEVRLAGARRTDDDEKPSPAGEGVVQPRVEDGQLVETGDLVLREAVVREVGERPAPPERKRRTQLLRRLLVLARRQRRAAVGEALLEALPVELAGGDAERVGAADGPQGRAAVRELLSEGRDAVLQHLRRGRRRALPPELVDDRVPRQGLVRTEQ